MQLSGFGTFGGGHFSGQVRNNVKSWAKSGAKSRRLVPALPDATRVSSTADNAGSFAKFPCPAVFLGNIAALGESIANPVRRAVRLHGASWPVAIGGGRRNGVAAVFAAACTGWRIGHGPRSARPGKSCACDHPTVGLIPPEDLSIHRWKTKKISLILSYNMATRVSPRRHRPF